MENWFATAAMEFGIVVIGLILFGKFCSWAKKFSLPGKLKLWTYILLGLGVIGFNVWYKIAEKDVTQMPTVLVVSLVFVIFFSFVLMAETKQE